MNYAWLKAVTQQPPGLVRLAWEYSEVDGHTEWFDATDECLDILNDLRDKLESNLGHGDTFSLEVKNPSSSQKAAKKALEKISAQFRANNDQKPPWQHLTAEDPNPAPKRQETAAGYILLKWYTEGESYVRTEWIANTPTNLQMIAQIRRHLEEHFGTGLNGQPRAFNYEFDDGVDSRFTARDLSARLRTQLRQDGEPSSEP